MKERDEVARIRPIMTKDRAIELLRDELQAILEWHKCEKIPLREQELESIRRTLAETRRT